MLIDFASWLGIQQLLATLLVTLGVGQLMASHLGLRGASLVGDRRWLGYALGLLFVTVGSFLLPNSVAVMWWVIPAVPIAILILFMGGSYILPPPSIDALFEPKHPAHKSCRKISIPDGNHFVPGFLLLPQSKVATGDAVCLVHGFGDSKNAFKWRLVRALLKKGLTVLSIDLPGHGEYRHVPLVYPNALSTIPAAIRFLHTRPDVRSVGVIGLSLGGAMSIASLAHNEAAQKAVSSLVVIGTPIKAKYSPVLYYHELWNTYCGSPSLSLLQETSIKQIWQAWHSGYSSIEHQVDELFELLAPVKNIAKLNNLPILLVYSRRDVVAPLTHAQALLEAAPQAKVMQLRSPSHLLLTLLPRINKKIARWIVKTNKTADKQDSNHQVSLTETSLKLS